MILIRNFGSQMLDMQNPIRRRSAQSVEAAPSDCDTSALRRDLPDVLSRRVYCVLGIPIDLVTMSEVLACIETAAFRATPFMLSTPNLNFLITSQTDIEFRETLLLSDLCPVDGTPILWIARLLGVPITQRVAGSDIFEALKSSANPLKIFFFGGAEGVAAAAARALNRGSGKLNCVGTLNPGFCSIDDMSKDDIIDQINASSAEFLVASLGARKGQLWLQRNFDRLHIPIRAHLGAVVNFQAGIIKRAPAVIGKCGLEWLWRIKQEPHLYRRYLSDGTALLRLLFTGILPLATRSWCLKLSRAARGLDCFVSPTHDDKFVMVSFSGDATARNIERAILVLREAIAFGKHLKIDFSATQEIDARFLGLLLMVRKMLKAKGMVLSISALSPSLERVFRLHGVTYLISDI